MLEDNELFLYEKDLIGRFIELKDDPYAINKFGGKTEEKLKVYGEIFDKYTEYKNIRTLPSYENKKIAESVLYTGIYNKLFDRDNGEPVLYFEKDGSLHLCPMVRIIVDNDQLVPEVLRPANLLKDGETPTGNLIRNRIKNTSYFLFKKIRNKKRNKLGLRHRHLGLWGKHRRFGAKQGGGGFGNPGFQRRFSRKFSQRRF